MKEWIKFKHKYGKRYNVDEDRERFSIFAETKKRIDAHNEQFEKGNTTFKMKMNHLSDLRPEEIEQMKGYRRPTIRPIGDFSYMAPHNEVLPKTVDWRKHGYVTKVKNQKQCGSCWAFSATGALEGQHKRKTGKLVSLSEQNLVDCDKNSYGCYGGWSENAFTYVKNNTGIDTEKSYPYEAKDGKCRFKRKTVGASCTGFVDLPQDEKSLQKAVATVGPISVSIDARHNSFYNYRSGVYYEPDCDPNDLDHSVLVVGYGTTKKGRKYWLVKNSWATDWGLKGYIKMSRDRGNNCGIASDACYPTV